MHVLLNSIEFHVVSSIRTKSLQAFMSYCEKRVQMFLGFGLVVVFAIVSFYNVDESQRARLKEVLEMWHVCGPHMPINVSIYEILQNLLLVFQLFEVF